MTKKHGHKNMFINRKRNKLNNNEQFELVAGFGESCKSN